jgi:hypothetical protein
MIHRTAGKHVGTLTSAVQDAERSAHQSPTVTAATSWRARSAANPDAQLAPPNALFSTSGVTHHLRVHFVRADAVRWVDLEWPGWVEVQLRESDGAVVSLVDKVPIFDQTDRLAAGTTLPVDVEVPCDVLERAVDAAGNWSCLVRLRYDVEDQGGRTTFRVAEHSVVWRT